MFPYCQKWRKTMSSIPKHNFDRLEKPTPPQKYNLLKYLQYREFLVRPRINESSQLSTDQSREACRVHFIQQCHSLACSWHKNGIRIMFRASFKSKRTDRTDLSCMARNIRLNESNCQKKTKIEFWAKTKTFGHGRICSNKRYASRRAYY